MGSLVIFDRRETCLGNISLLGRAAQMWYPRLHACLLWAESLVHWLRSTRKLFLLQVGSFVITMCMLGQKCTVRKS